MNKAIDFLETAINSSQTYLGINQFACLDLTVEFLCKTKDKANQHLVDLTIVGLYNLINDQMLENYDNKNPIFVAINKLLNSSWEQEVSSKLIELYIIDYSRENIDKFLNILLLNKENESRYLASEKLVDYFDQRIENLSEVEKIIYCIHILNVAYFFHEGNLTFNQLHFVKYIRYNLILMTESFTVPVRRMAIWALFWVVGGFTKNDSLIEIDSKFQNHVSSLFSKIFDIKTKFRLSVILIKSERGISNQIGKNYTYSWIKNIYDERIEKEIKSSFTFIYANLVENIFLQGLKLNEKLWINEVIIPYLGLMGTDSIIPILKENLKSNDSLKIRSAVILSGLGLLTKEQIEEYNIKKSEVYDEMIRSNPDYCYSVIGKDITGEIAWYIVLIDREKLVDFSTHKPGDSYNITDYGSIVESGYGDTVPDDVKKTLKEKYELEF